MKKTFIALSIAAMSSAVTAGVQYSHYNGHPYEGGKPVQLENGITANMSELSLSNDLFRISTVDFHTELTPNVYQMGGKFYAPTVIETDEGLLVFNSGEHADDGEHFRNYIREHISTKPIIAVFYDHAHYQYGTKTLLDGDDAIIVGHEIANELEASKGDGAIAKTPIPELRNTLNARAANQFGLNISGEHNKADLSPTGVEVELKDSAFMEVTHPLGHGDSVTVGGIEVVGYHAITDSEDTVTYHIPKYDLVLDNVSWATQNTYTLRGDQYRSPVQWINDLKLIRDLNPEILVSIGGGGKPIIGRENVQYALSGIMDSMAFTHDQAIRHTNNGVKPNQLKHVIELPEELKEHIAVNNYYGQREHFYESTPNINAGWFSGYAEDMHNLPDAVYAEYMLKLIGSERVEQAYKQATEKGEHLWAKELAMIMYNNNPTDENVRQNLADTFRSLGQLSPGVIARNMYLSAAQSLEGNDTITMTVVESAEWAANDLETSVDFLRVRIVPELAAGKSGFLVLDFGADQFGLDIRNGIAEFVADVESNYREATEVLKLSAEDFGKYFAGELAATELAPEGSMLHLFEEFNPRPMY